MRKGKRLKDIVPNETLRILLFPLVLMAVLVTVATCTVLLLTANGVKADKIMESAFYFLGDK